MLTTISDRSVTLQDVQAASMRIREFVQRTPCPPSIPLSLVTGCQIYCKLEYLQRTGSFKERGARNALLLLSPQQRERGVIAASAGNHALGLAYHADLLKIPATVVVPKFAPLTKVRNCAQMGARVLTRGSNIDEARKYAVDLGEKEGLTYIHGFNDPAIIAGQGTLALEILEQVPDVEALIIPIGGGGLLAGMAVAVKSLKPAVQIVGVEPAGAASFGAALAAGKPVLIEMQPSLADGLAVPCVGDLAFQISRVLLDRHVLVSENSIAQAIVRLVELEKAVVEGAGAVPLAACLAGLVPDLQGKKVVLPLCGGNIDTNVLGSVLERGLAADGRLCRFSAVISDRPGGLSTFAALVAEEGASIKEIFHDRAFATADITTVTIYCVVETRDFDHIRQLESRLKSAGFAVHFPSPG